MHYSNYKKANQVSKRKFIKEQGAPSTKKNEGRKMKFIEEQENYR